MTPDHCEDHLRFPASCPIEKLKNMPGKILLQEDPYAIWRYDHIPEEAIEFLDGIAWGNDGAVYEHKNTQEHIRLLHRPTLVAIRDAQQIQGTAVFCQTPVSAGAQTYNCYYIRYFASSPAIRGQGVVKKYAVKVMEVIREDETEKSVFFACIEKGNRASYRAVESAGYQNIGTIKTVGFSRFFPKQSPRLQRVRGIAARQEVLALLQEQFQAHALVQFNSLFLHDDYFVLRENGEVVAGCQFHRVHWVVNRMAGFSGKVIMKVVPHMPLLNQLFNPERFEFLAFEGIYCRPGYEKRLYELFEGLLAQEGLKSAMLWLGESCPLRQRLLARGHLGLLHRFVKDSDVYILAAFHDLSAAEIEDLKQRPLFASAFDYI